MTTGWTDGSELGGIETGGGTPGAAYFRKNAYGLPVGSAVLDNPPFTNDLTVGLTTDPTKSGIIVESDSDLVVCIKF